MPPRLEYFVVSESVSVDALTNRVSLFNILEVIRSRRFPGVYPALYATAVWLIEDQERGTDYTTMLRVTVPGGQQQEYTSNFTAQGRRHRIFQRLEGIPLAQPGQITFELLLNAQHAAQHIIDVELAPDVIQPTTDDEQTSH